MECTTWEFRNGITWTSYGPGGLTVTYPDGTKVVNPDPSVFVPLNARVRPHVRVVLVPKQTLAAGVVLESVT